MALDNQLLATPEGSWAATNIESTAGLLEEGKSVTAIEAIGRGPGGHQAGGVHHSRPIVDGGPHERTGCSARNGREQNVIQIQQLATAAML